MGVSIQQHRLAMADGVNLFVQTAGMNSNGIEYSRDHSGSLDRQRQAVLFLHPHGQLRTSRSSPMRFEF